uniref:Uncharacterized protein n=1 Tax=Anguilla anguilla TaxID=7936 RepID=A0A0E9W7R1_ANGAN
MCPTHGARWNIFTSATFGKTVRNVIRKCWESIFGVYL